MFHRLTILAAMAAFLFCASTEMADAKRRPETCGDNFIDSGEQCDGTDLGAATCGDFGYTAGDVTCGTSCKLDASGCYCAATDTCGDGVIDAGEECDQGNLNGETCADQGKYGDGLVCGADCVLDTSGCSDVRYVDNSDGTVTDIETGLTWQKTDDANGLTDKDNTYTWSAAFLGTAPTGTAFTVFLAGLNGADDGTCFANHCDWRIPTIEELQTILLEPFPCGTNPCINQAVFGPQNASSGYWSSTTFADDPTAAKDVPFDYGDVVNDAKDSPLYARAVRGGS